jgi:hypothetical protein
VRFGHAKALQKNVATVSKEQNAELPMRRMFQAVCIAVAIFSASPAWPGELSDRIELESNASVGSFSAAYADASLTFSPFAPYYDSGLRLRFTTSYAQYTYPDAAKTFVSKGKDTEADLLVGYNFQFDRWSLLLLAGPSLTWSMQSPGDLSLTSETTKAGARAVVSIMFNPTDATMLYAQSSFSSPNNAYYAQLKFGAAIRPKVFLGPEFALSGRAIMDGSNLTSFSTDLQQWKIGGFLSGLEIGPLQFGLSAGYLNDRQQGNGAYAGTSVRATF